MHTLLNLRSDLATWLRIFSAKGVYLLLHPALGLLRGTSELDMQILTGYPRAPYHLWTANGPKRAMPKRMVELHSARSCFIFGLLRTSRRRTAPQEGCERRRHQRGAICIVSVRRTLSNFGEAVAVYPAAAFFVPNAVRYRKTFQELEI